MKCFYHQTVDAIGTCKSCYKGLCPDCASERSKGLACRGRCEGDVDRVSALIDRNIRLVPTSDQMITANKQGMVWSGVFLIVLGVGLVSIGLLSNPRTLPFSLFMGVAFIAYGALQFMRYRRVANAQQ